MWQSRHLVSHTSYLFPKHFYFPWNHSLIALPISAVVTYIIGKLLHYISYFSEYFSTLSTSPPLMLMLHASSTSARSFTLLFSSPEYHLPSSWHLHQKWCDCFGGSWCLSGVYQKMVRHSSAFFSTQFSSNNQHICFCNNILLHIIYQCHVTHPSFHHSYRFMCIEIQIQYWETNENTCFRTSLY